jgi:hypothetical protein
MFKHQFNLLVVATLLLSPTLVHADEINDSTHLSVGNIHLQTSPNGGVNIQTPNIHINTDKPPADRTLISRNRRRYRAPVRRARTYPPAILNQRINRDDQSTGTRTSTVRTSTIRSSDNGSQSTSEQHQSVQCSHGSGSSSVVQSSQTINGRTVSSEVHCN